MGQNWSVWLQGIVAAAIGGAATGVTTMAIAPDSFNFDTGLSKLGTVCFVSAIVNVASYLKQSPIPK